MKLLLLLLLLFVAVATSDWPVCPCERPAFEDGVADPSWCDSDWQAHPMLRIDKLYQLRCWCLGECEDLLTLILTCKTLPRSLFPEMCGPLLGRVY